MAKRLIHPVENERVRLRLLAADDLPTTLTWRNRADIRRWFFSSEVISAEQHTGWFSKYLERDDDFVFIIEERAEGFRPVGQVALYRVNWAAGRAEFGRLMIGTAGAAGKGLASSATRLALKIAFEQFDLREVYLDVFSNNLRAIDLYHATGFSDLYQDEAVLRMRITVSSDANAHVIMETAP